MSLPYSHTAILQEVADGEPLRVIAQKRAIPYSRVRRYLSNVYQALGADTLPHAIAIAFRKGIIK